MGLELPTDPKIGKSGLVRWYYVADRLSRRMLGNDPNSNLGRFIAFDLANSQILLFNSYRQATDMAKKWKAVVKIYPYDLDKMRAHWRDYGPSR